MKTEIEILEDKIELLEQKVEMIMNYFHGQGITANVAFR